MNCLIKNCEGDHYAKRYCQHHYDKIKRHGSPYFQRQLKKDLLCIAPECDRKRFAKDMCMKHYVKIRKTGTLKQLQVYGEESKQKSRARTAKWKKDNWGYYKAYLLSRKKRIKVATPKWADKKEIIEFYKKCPKGFHIDHVIPLNGKNVSGLHVTYNLQYLPKIENLRKGTKFLQGGLLQDSTAHKFNLEG
jgi:hypothetical protein